MTENEFILQDRIAKIQSVIRQYGQDNFAFAFSGGKDSMVIHTLLDIAIPNNEIPRVYTNTGIEYKKMVEFVQSLGAFDNRICIVQPTVPVMSMLKEVGYPFKSKSHSVFVERFQNSGKTTSVLQYLGERTDKAPWSAEKSCPKCLKYQFTNDFNIKISDRCCIKLKEEPTKKWMKENNKKYSIVGITRDEGGRRSSAVCMRFRDGKFKEFHPLAPITKLWEDWFIKEYNIKLCELYYPPYNFNRTGCKGCPFNVKLQNELKTIAAFFPNEAAQCERIWKPVYDEYKRINYRLKKED